MLMNEYLLIIFIIYLNNDCINKILHYLKIYISRYFPECQYRKIAINLH